MTTWTRDFYIPKGSRKIAPKGLPLTFYAYETATHFIAQCFIGKAAKPAWHYRFTTAAKREAYVTKQIEATRHREEAKASRRKSASKGHGWEVGMILTGSWGYEQTNVDFFEIVKVTKCFVEIEEIGGQSATDAGERAWATDKVVPNPEARTGKVTRHKVSDGMIRSPKHGIARVWDGTPKMETSYH